MGLRAPRGCGALRPLQNGRGAAGVVDAGQVPVPAVHLDMQAALQPFADNAISRTVNVAADWQRADAEGSLARVCGFPRRGGS